MASQKLPSGLCQGFDKANIPASFNGGSKAPRNRYLWELYFRRMICDSIQLVSENVIHVRRNREKVLQLLLPLHTCTLSAKSNQTDICPFGKSRKRLMRNSLS